MSVFAAGLFDGQVAVITGGGTGLGREVAHAFARLGGHPVIAGRTAARLDEVAASIGRRAGAAPPCRPTSASPTRSRRSATPSTAASAGWTAWSTTRAASSRPLPSAITDNGWRSVVDLNLNGTWNMTNRFMAPMAAAGTGAIVNVVHTFSFERGAPMFAHSGAARAGVVNLVKTLAPYLMRRGVTINAFAPGIFSSPGLAESELAAVGRTEEGFTDELVAEGTTVRLGTVDEMAAMVLFLCSPAARYVCGATIIADGALDADELGQLLPRRRDVSRASPGTARPG